ncbi:hypothetical protein HK100_006788 [Physocladia obscura]|uniref:Uncharacterized protein n=1 Tax=Physocladia obscura TaxID=109957 RepID=A0AAD5SSP4_9FUNG|nr:hypothetical protein HK100_006788 [Physocladia obscura]
MVEATPLATITDPYTLEMKARFKLMKHGLLYGSTVNELLLPKNGRSPGDLGSGGGVSSIGGATARERAKAGISALEEARAVAENEVFTEVNEIFVHGAKVLPKSCMVMPYSI